MMKKIILGVFLIAALGCSPLCCFAECNCTTSQIVNKLKNASGSDLEDIFEKMIDSADFSPSYTVRNSFAKIIYESKNEYYFRNALKSYINNYCTVTNNKIVCK